MKNRMLFCLSALAMIGVVSCDDSTEPTPLGNKVVFTATLTPGAEVPAVTNSPNGLGTFTAALDTVTNIMTYDVTYSGLSANVTVGHIHGPADATQTASPILTFSNTNGQQFSTGVTSGTAHGVVLLTSTTSFTPTVNGDSLKKLLFAGKTYANVHTTGPNAAGEIRGQITLKTP